MKLDVTESEFEKIFLKPIREVEELRAKIVILQGMEEMRQRLGGTPPFPFAESTGVGAIAPTPITIPYATEWPTPRLLPQSEPQYIQPQPYIQPQQYPLPLTVEAIAPGHSQDGWQPQLTAATESADREADKWFPFLALCAVVGCVIAGILVKNPSFFSIDNSDPPIEAHPTIEAVPSDPPPPPPQGQIPPVDPMIHTQDSSL